ncbi:MAG TPA: SDR family NAD(P)-dependent oxidoreductase, partial [Solirubrobacterales bacterium]
MSVKRLAGKRCLITGAGSGIGRATALAAGARGADLLLTDVNAEGLDRVAAEARASGARVSLQVPADLADHQAVVALSEQVHKAHGS